MKLNDVQYEIKDKLELFTVATNPTITENDYEFLYLETDSSIESDSNFIMFGGIFGLFFFFIILPLSLITFPLYSENVFHETIFFVWAVSILIGMIICFFKSIKYSNDKRRSRAVKTLRIKTIIDRLNADIETYSIKDPVTNLTCDKVFERKAFCKFILDIKREEYLKSLGEENEIN